MKQSEIKQLCKKEDKIINTIWMKESKIEKQSNKHKILNTINIKQTKIKMLCNKGNKILNTIQMNQSEIKKLCNKDDGDPEYHTDEAKQNKKSYTTKKTKWKIPNR